MNGIREKSGTTQIRLGFVFGVTGLAIAAVWFVGLCVTALTTPGQNHLDHYAAADRALSASGARPDVVFIGDSITERWPSHGASSWRAAWLNRGIGGERSDQIRARFGQDVVSLHPLSVVILAGTNDAWVNRPDLPLEATERDIREMADQARAAGIHVVIASVPPIGPKVTADGLPMPANVNQRIKAQNAWEKAYAAQHGDRFADYWSVVRPDLTIDGVHPSADGYAEMGPVAERAITAR